MAGNGQINTCIFYFTQVLKRYCTGTGSTWRYGVGAARQRRAHRHERLQLDAQQARPALPLEHARGVKRVGQRHGVRDLVGRDLKLLGHGPREQRPLIVEAEASLAQQQLGEEERLEPPAPHQHTS